MFVFKVFNSLTGEAFKAEVPEATSVQGLKATLAEKMKVPSDDQILLCNGMKMDSDKHVDFYNPEESGGAVYLYDRRKLAENASSIDPVVVPQPMYNTPDRKTTNSSISLGQYNDDKNLRTLLEFKDDCEYYIACANPLVQVGKQRLKLAKKYISEQMVIVTAFHTARTNLDVHNGQNEKSFLSFLSQWEKQKENQSKVLKRFGEDIQVLNNMELHESLKTDTRKTLADCVPLDDLRNWAKECEQQHTRLIQSVTDLEKGYNGMKSRVQDLMQSELVIDRPQIDDQIPSLVDQQSTIQDTIAKYYQNLSSVIEEAKASLQMGNDDLDLESAATAFADVKGIWENGLKELREIDSTLDKYVAAIAMDKTSLARQAQRGLQEVAALESMFRSLNSKLMVFSNSISTTAHNFSHLQNVGKLPSAYRATLAEVVRRLNFGQLYRTGARNAAEQFAKQRDEELAVRELFFKKQGKFLPKNLVPGLNERPGYVNVSAPRMDLDLPDIKFKDVDESLQFSFEDVRTARKEAGEEEDMVDREEVLDFEERIRTLELENYTLKEHLAAHLLASDVADIDIVHTSEQSMKLLGEFQTNKVKSMQQELDKQKQMVAMYQDRIADLERQASSMSSSTMTGLGQPSKSSDEEMAQQIKELRTMLREQKESSSKDLESLEDELQKVQSERAMFEKVNANLMEERNHLKQEKETLQKAVDNATVYNNQNMDAVREKLLQTKQELAEAETKCKDLVQRNEALQTDIAEERKANGFLEQRIESLTATVSTLTNDLDTLRTGKATIQDELATLLDTYSKAENKLADTESQLQKTRKELNNLLDQSSGASETLQAALVNERERADRAQQETELEQTKFKLVKQEMDILKQELHDANHVNAMTSQELNLMKDRVADLQRQKEEQMVRQLNRIAQLEADCEDKNVEISIKTSAVVATEQANKSMNNDFVMLAGMLDIDATNPKYRNDIKLRVQQMVGQGQNLDQKSSSSGSSSSNSSSNDDRVSVVLEKFNYDDMVLFQKKRHGDGFYQVFNRNCPNYFLSEASEATLEERSPPFVLGRIIEIEQHTVTDESNKFGLAAGLKYHLVTAFMDLDV
eukprot:TRINITY_DN808_c0_g1_i1.p1 TRINITY_DN808_c0_g1~~TRINITY_DN808_c0_g1_i1.p1  ORF type:complete len:1103 (+),score=446.61 TRINITY_DN808_c0_g1_i1:33-3311(+)